MANSKPLTLAQSPFNDRTTADVVLGTSDRVIFYVHKIILSLASPFFKDMFSMAQPFSSDEENDPRSAEGLPIIFVSEDSDVIHRLLLLCYPVDDPTFNNPDEVQKVLEAAMKYDMTEATQVLPKSLRSFIETDPVRVYTISRRFGLEQEAKEVENWLRRKGLVISRREDNSNSQGIPVSGYFFVAALLLFVVIRTH